MLLAGYTKWKALVLHSSGPQFEAVIYKQLNSGATRKPLTSGELFKGCLVAKDPVAEATVRAIQGAGLKWTYLRRGSHGFPELTCIGLLYKLTQRWGEDLMREALALIARTWPGQKEVMGELFSYSVSYLMGTQADVFDPNRFEEVLSKIPPRQILLEASNNLGSRYLGAVKSLCHHYNTRLRNEKIKLKIAEESVA
jgi:hypothetical protein